MKTRQLAYVREMAPNSSLDSLATVLECNDKFTADFHCKRIL